MLFSIRALDISVQGEAQIFLRQTLCSYTIYFAPDQLSKRTRSKIKFIPYLIDSKVASRIFVLNRMCRKSSQRNDSTDFEPQSDLITASPNVGIGTRPLDE
ncbi:hypothetical protein BY996DRAFT_6468729 [Phakopsora pachyrhizi]|nr:hypothetical protein BY996DRAFT_6468729 [Phakopsora pachyrhizi]